MSSGKNVPQEISPSEALSNWYVQASEFNRQRSEVQMYRFCAGGVGLGAAYAMKFKKGMLPMVAAGVAGTTADLVYGYFSACKEEADRYNQSASGGQSSM